MPALIEQLSPLAERACPRLVEIYQVEPPDSRRRLHAALALQCSPHAPRDDSQAPAILDFLLDRLLHVELPDCEVLTEALAAHRPQLVDRLWETLEDRDSFGNAAGWFRAALALAAYAPPVDEAAASRWRCSAEAVARQLVAAVAANPSHYGRLLEAVRPLRALLREPLGQLFRREEDATLRSWSTSLAVDLAADLPDDLVNLVVDADSRQFAPVFARLEGHAARATGLLTERLRERVDDKADDAVKEILARRQANAGVALVQLGQAEPVWPQLRFEPDPRRRSYLIHGLAALGAGAGVLLSRLQQEADVSVRRALIVTLGEMAARLSGELRGALVRLLAQAYRHDPDPGIHGAARWSLLQLDQPSQLAEVEHQLATGSVEGNRRWYVNRQGQTFTVIPGPVEFWMGSPDTEAERERGQERDIELQHFRRIGRSFAIASTSVSRHGWPRT